MTSTSACQAPPRRASRKSTASSSIVCAISSTTSFSDRVKMIQKFLFLTAILASITLAQGCATDHRTVGTQLDDENIELSVRKALTDDNRLGDDVHVNITCLNGTLLLTGEATTAEQREIVVSRARRFEGVKRVVSEINVAEPTAFASRVHDSWITGQVKAKLLDTPNLKSTRI